MKFATEYLWFNTSKKREYINITDNPGDGGDIQVAGHGFTDTVDDILY